MRRECRLALVVAYDEQYTDPEALAEELSFLLNTAFGTCGLLDHGSVIISDFEPLDEEAFDE